MARSKSKKNQMERTSIWLEPEVRKAADRRAAKLGISRAFLIRQVLRRELGMETVSNQEALSGTVFG